MPNAVGVIARLQRSEPGGRTHVVCAALWPEDEDRARTASDTVLGRSSRRAGVGSVQPGEANARLSGLVTVSRPVVASKLQKTLRGCRYRSGGPRPRRTGTTVGQLPKLNQSEGFGKTVLPRFAIPRIDKVNTSERIPSENAGPLTPIP